MEKWRPTTTLACLATLLPGKMTKRKGLPLVRHAPLAPSCISCTVCACTINATKMGLAWPHGPVHCRCLGSNKPPAVQSPTGMCSASITAVSTSILAPSSVLSHSLLAAHS